MRFLPLFLALVLSAGAQVKFTPPPTPSVDVDRAVDVLLQAEHWDGYTRGAAGEWGWWQFIPSVWAQLSPVPQKRADYATQRAAAKKHVRWILERLPALHLPQTAYSVGLVWCAGCRNVAIGRVSRAKFEYADRVSNLYGP